MQAESGPHTTALRLEHPSDLEAMGDALAVFGVGLHVIDRSMQIIYANDVVEGAATTDGCAGEHCFATLWGARQRCPDCLPLLVFRTGEAQEGLRARARTGKPADLFRVRAVPILDPRGEHLYVGESFVPVSGPLGGDTLGLAQSSGTPTLVVDYEDRILSWSPGVAAMFGYGVEEVLGRRVDILVPPDLAGEQREFAATVARDGKVPRFETVRLAKDGRRVPVAITALAVHDEAGRLIGRSCVFEDLSALQALQRQLIAQQELLAHIGRSAADAIIGVDRDGRVTSWNAAAEQLIGRTAQSTSGELLATLVGDPGLEALLAEVRELGAGRIARTEWRDLKGQPVPVEVSAAALTDGNGEHGGIALVARDVSARQRLDRQLMRSEKLAVTGSLAAGLAHEIGTPLNVISATAEYLMLDAASEPTRERLRGIVAETDRISRLVRELLSFARGVTQREREDVDVHEALDRVRSLVSIPLERKHVELLTRIQPDLPRVRVEPDGLHQVLLNLILNAVAAVRGGGRVGVRASVTGPTVSLEVHDDGPGVPPGLRERIFDPFFTTRAEGTGLGLAVCARVVSEHGGDIRVGEGPLGGASFVVQLPVAEAKP